MKSLIVYTYIFIVLFTGRLGWTKIIYVDHAATGENNGSGWTDAYVDLHDALASAEANDEIWVAQGIYTPAEPDGERDRSFSLAAAVNVYGGFMGTEVNLEERVWNQHPTILSGDLNANDEESMDETREDNSYHVVTITGTGNNALIDGFIIRDGHAVGPESDLASSQQNGGGIFINETDQDEPVGPSVVNCILRNNSTLFPEFSSNTSAGLGGGIHIGRSNVRIEGCMFTENTSFRGGGLSVDFSSLRLINCVFLITWQKKRGVACGTGEARPCTRIVRLSATWRKSMEESISSRYHPQYSIPSVGVTG